MNKLALSSALAVALVAADAHAVILKNQDTKTQTVLIQTKTKRQAVKMKPGDMYDTKHEDAAFFLDYVRYTGKKDEEYIIKDKKIIPDPEAEKRKAEAAKKAEEEKASPPPAGAPAPAPATPTPKY